MIATVSAGQDQSQADTLALLRRLSGAEPVQTHISYVFVGSEMVWKLKKAVRLSFLDFSTLEARHRFVQREFDLNRAAAPGLYRDVVPVVRQSDGTVALGEPGDRRSAVDWVLRMAPVPPADFVDSLAAAGRLTPELLDALADSVSAYHRSLAPLPSARPDMPAVVAGNVRAALDAGLDRDVVLDVRDAECAALEGLDPWLEQRARNGLVRRAHGDLHLGNVCLWQGKPVPFDALEFDEELATIDLAYDLAFLLMDLDQRVSRAAANRVMNRYAARSGDAALVRGLPAFLSLRALVRAHVEARIGHTEPARRYLDAARSYMRPAPALLMAIGGLPGSGKSTLARGLAPELGRAPGALVLRSDEIRKRQYGAAPEQRLPQDAYSDVASMAVFTILAADSAGAVAGGHCAIADATFLDPLHRGMLENAARSAGVPFLGLWLRAPLAELERRIAARTRDASDATIAVLRQAARHDPGPGTWHPIEAADPAAVLDLARAALHAHIVPR